MTPVHHTARTIAARLTWWKWIASTGFAVVICAILIAFIRTEFSTALRDSQQQASQDHDFIRTKFYESVSVQSAALTQAASALSSQAIASERQAAATQSMAETVKRLADEQRENMKSISSEHRDLADRFDGMRDKLAEAVNAAAAMIELHRESSAQEPPPPTPNE